MHSRVKKPRKEENCTRDNYKIRSGTGDYFGNENYISYYKNSKTNNKIVPKHKNKRKISNSKSVYELNDKTHVISKIGNDCTKTVDLIINVELQKKRSEYINAYFTESDLNNRKMFHENNKKQSLIKEIPTKLKVEVLKDPSNKLSSKDYFINIMKKNHKKIKEARRDIKGLCYQTSNYKLYHPKDIFKDLDRYFNEAGSGRRRKHFYQNESNLANGQTTNYSPEVKHSSINLLFNNHDKYNADLNKYKIKNGCNFNSKENLAVVDSKSCTRLRKKMVDNIKNTNDYQAKQKKSYDSLADIPNDDTKIMKHNTMINNSINKTNKGSDFYSKTEFPLKNFRNLSFQLAANAHNIHLSDAYYSYSKDNNSNFKNCDNQNPGNFKSYNESFIDTTSWINAHCNDKYDISFENKLLSDGTILDDSNRGDDLYSTINSSEKYPDEILSNSTITNYNANKFYKKHGKTYRKPSCEIFLTRLKNKKGRKKFDYNTFLRDLLPKKQMLEIKSKHSLHILDQFEKKFRNYFIDKDLKEYNLRRRLHKVNSCTQSEFMPLQNEKVFISRPNSVEKDISIEKFSKTANNSERIYNYCAPFSLNVLEGKENNKYCFDRENFDTSKVFDLDEDALKHKSSKEVTLKLSIPYIYVIKDVDHHCKFSNSTSTSRRESGSTHDKIDDSDFVNVQDNSINEEKVTDVRILPLNKTFLDENNSKNADCFNKINVLENITEESTETMSLRNENFSQPGDLNFHCEKIQRYFQNVKNQIDPKELEISEPFFTSGSIGENKRKVVDSVSVEIIFPVKSKRNFCHSYTTLITRSVQILSSESTKLRSCKSDTSHESQRLMKNYTNKNFKIDKTYSNLITKTSKKENFTSLNNDTFEKKQSNSNIYEHDLLKSSKFKEEVENIIRKYLEDNILLNWMNKNKFDVFIIPNGDEKINNSEKIIEKLTMKQFQEKSRKIKSSSMKFFKFESSANIQNVFEQINCLQSNEKVKLNNSKPRSVLPYKSCEKCEKKLPKQMLFDGSKIQSLPAFNVSKLKVQKGSVIYYTRINHHSVKIKRPKLKPILSDEKKKDTAVLRNVTDKSVKNKHLRKKSKKKNSLMEAENQSEIFVELNKFKALLTEVEKKQESILTILNKDPCGLLFNFPVDK